ncbi:MAG: glycosyltransferase family 4 protein [Alphaproteobacteria bacterium]|nr:glycosyltransferase family 4 protein [Alphaproteobacteria bacterium]
MDFEGVFAFLGVYFKFLRHLIFSRITIVYLLLSSSKVGFLRDSVLIFTASLFGKTVVAHYRGGNFHNFYNSSTSLYKKLIETTMDRIDTVIVLANSLKFMFEKLVDSERIKVLYNGLPVEEYSSIERKPHNKNAVTILFMGHLTFPKGFYDLIRAYKRLRNTYSHIRLAFAGGMPGINPEHKNLLQDSAREYFLSHIDEITNETLSFIENAASYNAKYLGFVSSEKKIRVFADADILVFPSYSEGFPMVVLEAMASGLPVVATPVGALPEILKDGVNGLFVKIGDAQDLAEKIETLIKDKEFRGKIGSFNKDYVSKRFDIKTITEDLVNIWTKTLEKAS